MSPRGAKGAGGPSSGWEDDAPGAGYIAPPPSAPPSYTPPPTASPNYGPPTSPPPPAYGPPPTAPPPYAPSPGFGNPSSHLPPRRFSQQGSGRPPVALLAGWWRRCLGAIIDSLIGFGLTLIAGLGAGVNSIRIGDNHVDMATFVVAFLISHVVFFLYLVLMLAIRGQTLGMMAVGVRLNDATTGSPDVGFAQVIFRSLLWEALSSPYTFVPFAGILLLLDYLWPIWDARRQTLHDKAGSTVVVLA